METTAPLTAAHESRVERTPAGGNSGANSTGNSALFGAAVALALGGLGVVVPLTAAACQGVMKGLAQPLPPPTRMVISVGWWWIAVAVAIVASLYAVERAVGNRRAAPMHAAMLLLIALVAATALLAVVMPLLSMGRSLSS